MRDRLSSKRKFEDLAAAALRPLGFESPRRGLLTCLGGPDVEDDQVKGWLGLNIAVDRDDAIEVNPVFGVRHQGVQALKAELLEVKDRRHSPPTVAASLGYLTPANTYRPYLFSDERSARKASQELAADVERYGLPFVRAHRSLRALAEALEHPPFDSGERMSYELPLIYFLLGETGRARALLDKRLARESAATYLAAVTYRRFASRLLGRMET